MNLTDVGGTIVKEITIKGSAERIFEALTNPDQRVKWWGAEGRFQTTHMESDLRPGGRWVMRGTGMGGKPFSVLGTYRTIERPHLLVFTWLPDWHEGATESAVRFDLKEKDGVTTVRLTHSRLTSEGARTSRLAADSASIRGGPPPRARLTLHLSLPRTAVYFLALSALNISKPSAGLRFLCTTAWTALIIACGASDWKMLRPMSTPAAPCWTAL